MTENKTYKQKDVDIIIKTVNNIKEQFIESIDCQLSELSNLQPVEVAEPEQERKEWRTKPEYGETYYCISIQREVITFRWSSCLFDDEYYNSGNCFPCKFFTKEQVQQIALMNQLNSLLTQYAIVNGALASEEEKEDDGNFLYFLYESGINLSCAYHPSGVLFNSEDVAKKAIKDVVEPFLAEHPEFVW